MNDPATSRIEAGPTATADMNPSELVEVCRVLGKRFAKRAAQYDRDGSFPVENFEELKEAGLLGLMIPGEYGGLGADFATYTLALEQIARGDSSTGLTFNMHNIAVGSIAEIDLDAVPGRHGDTMRRFRDWVYHEAVVNRKIFASASSEPGIGAHFSKMKTTYDRTDDGYVINGVKNWVSMAGYADYYVVAARASQIKSDVPPISFLVVEKDNPGARIEFDWDVLGMRATSTNPVYFENCLVPKEALFLGSEGMALFKIAREPHWLIGGYIGVYLGVCSETFEFMVNFLKTKKVPGTDTPLSEDSRIQHRVGELFSALESARQVTYRAARLVSEKPGEQETNTAIHHAKYLVSELGPWLSSAAIRLCGGSTISKKMPLERFYRDSRCAGLMPATSDDCLLYLGKAAFGSDLTNPSETYW